jgi:hypothetical protein
MARKIKTIRRHEHLPGARFELAMAEVYRQTARGAAIAGTAYLDLLLRSVIETRIRSDSNLHIILFENRGPLQDFSARVQIAFAFNIIGSGAYCDLCALREIRNTFAHSADAFDFDRKDIASRCDDLWLPRHIHYENRPAPSTSREKFARAVELIADMLLEVLLRPESTFSQMGPPWPAPTHGSSPKKSHKRSPLDRLGPNRKTDQ